MEGTREKAGRTLRVVVGGAVPAHLPLAARTVEDAALAAAVLNGDRGAIDRVVQAHAARVFAVVRRYARTAQDARDLAQEALRRALAAAGRALRADPQRAIPLDRWLMRTGLRVVNRYMRHAVMRPGVRFEQLGPAESRPARGDEPRRAPGRAARVRREVLRLPIRLREVLTLRIDPDLSFPDIARVLGITQAAVVLDFHDATRRLRDVAGEPESARSACARWAVLLSSRAAGALDRAETGRTDAHLAGCPACCAAADATAEALRLAALGPPSPGEREITEELPARVVAAIEASERRRMTGWHILLTIALAFAAVATLVGAAAMFGALGAAP